MFSNFRLPKIFSLLLLEPLQIASYGFYPQYATGPENIVSFTNESQYLDFFSNDVNGYCLWWHEEPLNYYDFEKILDSYNNCPRDASYTAPTLPTVPNICNFYQDVNLQILVNSEKSNEKKKILQDFSMIDLYFFYHGLAALDWYRDYKYLILPNVTISKVFISLNHLLTKKRSYRLSLLSHLNQNNLNAQGFVSSPLLSKHLIKEEILDKNSLLTKPAKKHILENLYPTAQNVFLDENQNYRNASADIIENKFSLGALWHVVSETVYYDNSLHLTEKIFKPIVIKRPFILVGAVNNLQYLKDYGFQTFDRWIDESYDCEPDPDLRLAKIIQELKKLCALPQHELLQTYKEMNKVLEHNYYHFFNNFREIIVDEFIDNYKKAIFLYNKDKSERFCIDDKIINYEQIKKLLLS